VGHMAVTDSKRHFVIGLLCEITKTKFREHRLPAYFIQSARSIKRYVHFTETAALTEMTALSVSIHLLPHPQYKQV
jgi:hypothetical protein